MKKLMTLALAAAFAATLAACTDTDHGNITLPTPTEAATTENVEAAATETAEPVTTETAESTAEVVNPTEETKYAVLDFNECAEEVLRLKAFHDDTEKLPEDADGETVLYIKNTGGDVTDLGPSWFATDGETICVMDMNCDLQVYDANGFVRRVEADYPDGWRSACMVDGDIYSMRGSLDTATGRFKSRAKENMPAFMDNYYGTVHFFNYNGKPCFTSDSYNDEANNINYYYDIESASWIEGEKVCSYRSDDESTTVILSNGAKCRLPAKGYELIGIDKEGCLYFSCMDFNVGTDDAGAIDISFNLPESLVKADSNGNIVSMVTMPFDIYEDLWEPNYQYNLLPDGTVYVAAAMNDAYVIWKIAM